MITLGSRCAAPLLAFAVCVGSAVVAPQVASAAAHQRVVGSGSTGAANAVNQWTADEHQAGLQVAYSAVGSAQGRQDFARHTTDFAVTDLGYQGTDPSTGASDTSQGRSFAYLPLVAGGTSLPFHIEKHGMLVRNLRLSGATIAKIFTQKITNWDDAQITADNHGVALPDLTIIPVQHSEAAGSSYQFSRYLATQFPSIWTAGTDEKFPAPTGSAVAQNGSDGVMNYIASEQANGAIGYDEYSYALGRNAPVAQVENSSGYFTLPTQLNVAVALRRAAIDSDPSSPSYLLADLDGVYTNSDSRTYPLSSYTYAIIATASDDATMTTAKRQTIADFLGYGVCSGQREVGAVGDAPLPLNLVKAAFTQISRLHDADAAVDVSGLNEQNCSNPTFTSGSSPTDILDRVAPQPPECDSVAHNPCGTPPHPSSLAAPTRVTVVAPTSRTTLRTTLTDATSHGAVASVAATLWRRVGGSRTWSRVANLRTGSTGSVSATVSTTATSAYEFRYAGDLDHRAVTSAQAVLRVRPVASIHSTRSHVLLGQRVTLWGDVSPTHTGGNIAVEESVGGHWKILARTTQRRLTDPDGRVRVSWQVAAGLGRGTHRLRAVTGATPVQLSAASATVTVVVG